jgi:ribosomal protein L37AE/L43A
MHHLFDTTHVSAVLGMRPIGVIDMSDSMVGMKLAWGHFPPWTGNTIRRGAKISDKSKELMKQSSASRELHECPHCKRMLLMCNLVRWHGDNCKEKQ